MHTLPPYAAGGIKGRPVAAHGRLCQFGAERGRRRLLSPSAAVGRVEQAPDQRAADDHPVGERGHLGRLGTVADAEADADRQVGSTARTRATRAGAGCET